MPWFCDKKNLMVTQHNVIRVHVLAQRSSDEKLIQNVHVHVHVHVALELEEVGHDTHVIITWPWYALVWQQRRFDRIKRLQLADHMRPYFHIQVQVYGSTVFIAVPQLFCNKSVLYVFFVISTVFSLFIRRIFLIKHILPCSLLGAFCV